MPLKSSDPYQRQLARLRAFPEGTRNCYTIDGTKGTRYLIKAWFYYGNYDGKNKLPEFDIHVGANFWDSIKFQFDSPTRREIIHVPRQNYLRICIVDVGKGTPIISSLELRPLLNTTYIVTEDRTSLKYNTRVDLGSVTNVSHRFAISFSLRFYIYSCLKNYT